MFIFAFLMFGILNLIASEQKKENVPSGTWQHKKN
jgi:hypothetical protein